MANHKSAVKALRQSAERRTRNRELRTRMRRALRSTRSAIDSGDRAAAGETLRSTVSLLDRLASKRIIHQNAAARHKSRLNHRLKTVST